MYELIFTYSSNTAEYNYMAIDDISIINGVCRTYQNEKKTLFKNLRKKMKLILPINSNTKSQQSSATKKKTNDDR